MTVTNGMLGDVSESFEGRDSGPVATGNPLQRICHGDSGCGFQPAVIRQIGIIQRLRRQTLSSRHSAKACNRRIIHIHQSQRLQPHGGGHTSAEGIILCGRFLQRLVVHRIQQSGMAVHIRNARRVHGQAAGILVGDRAMSQRILRRHGMAAAAGIRRGPDLVFIVRTMRVCAGTVPVCIEFRLQQAGGVMSRRIVGPLTFGESGPGYR